MLKTHFVLPENGSLAIPGAKAPSSIECKNAKGDYKDWDGTGRPTPFNNLAATFVM